MAQREKSSVSELPTFKNEAEAAAFWDTHSPLDYPEQFQEVQASFSRPLSKRGLTVKLTQDTIEQLRRLAREKGIGPSTLARMWILERLRHHEEPPRPTKIP